MLSNDEEYGSEMDQGEKHRIRRACDVCRRRKSRCEGSQTPGAKCLTCLDANLECTYQAAARKRLTKSRYVVDLETRLEHSEALIRQLCNELARLRAELATARSHNSTQVSSTSDESNHAGDSNALTGRSATLHILRTALRTLSAPPPAPHAEDLLDAELESKMDQLSMNTTTRRFLGKSSDAALIKAAIDLKADVRRQEPQQTEPRRFSETLQVSSPMLPFYGMSPEGFPPNLWNPENGHDQEPLSGSDYWDGERDAGDWWTTRRPQYWMCKPWEDTALHTHAYSFPPPDLAAALIDLYFTRAHIYLPLLHRQTFDRNVETGVHHWDNSFAAIVLLVCAIGSRWSNDPRVLSSPGPNGGGTAAGHLHCGWEWFNQVPPAGKHLFGQGTLYDLQYYCLAVHFLLGSSAPQACWMLVGVGLRLAQDAGAHRRTSRVEEPSVERELWKRAFWVLVYLDGYVSTLMGRTCGIQYDDFDIEPIIECDDEYWEHPTRPFEQPAGVPSAIAFFNALLRLSHILECTLKILYSLGKVRARLTIDHGWEEHFVADLDSALNRWRDQIPEHLSWDPTRADPVFFDQSVALHCAYYKLEILIHRSFIPTVRKAAPTGLPSMVVCTSAARACANMVDIQRQRKGDEPVNFNMSAVLSSALVLLLNVWSGKRTGTPDPGRDIVNVHKCMEVLRLCEDRWPNAGMLRDVISELASVGQLPARSAPFGNDDGQQHRTAGNASDTAQSLSADDMLRIMLKSPGLQDAFDFPVRDPHLAAHLPQEYFESTIAGGAGPVDSNVFAPAPLPSNWLTPEQLLSGMDAAGRVSHEIDNMWDTNLTWLNVPTGFEVEDWGRNFADFEPRDDGCKI